jgi:hypothetical protein
MGLKCVECGSKKPCLDLSSVLVMRQCALVAVGEAAAPSLTIRAHQAKSLSFIVLARI